MKIDDILFVVVEDSGLTAHFVRVGKKAIIKTDPVHVFLSLAEASELGERLDVVVAAHASSKEE